MCLFLIKEGVLTYTESMQIDEKEMLRLYYANNRFNKDVESEMKRREKGR